MELRYVSEFAVLAEYKNFSRAAEELLISQPSLSKHIQSLENELGGTLFVRSPHGISLSEFGELFLPFAIRISKEQKEYEAVLQAYLKKQSASFTIGVVHNLQYYNVIKYLVSFHERYPDCIVNAVEFEENVLKSMLESKQLNLITKAIPSTEDPGIPFLPVAESHIVAVMSSDHPFADRQGITLEDLRHERLIVPERTSMFYNYILTVFRAAGIKPNIVYEGSSAGCLDFAKAGMGISLQSKELVEGQQNPEMRPVDVIPFISYRYGLMYRDKASLSSWERKFVNHVKQTRLDCLDQET